MTTNDTICGLSPQRMSVLLRPVVPPSTALDSADAVCALFARAVFSTLVEPGDTDASAVVESLGAPQTLRTLASDTPAATVRDRMRDADPGEYPPALERIESALGRWRGRLSTGAGAKTFERAAHLGALLLTPESPLWPGGLVDLQQGSPLALWVRGDPGRLSGLSRSVALVGARAASGYGEHVAVESASGLSDRGFAIVSGGAYGIDAAAHRATLASDQLTIAFLAGGVDQLYPAGNTALLQRIIASGLLVAELPPGSAPTRWRFLMRNRLIAAASRATVVVEAGRRSGSLNTAGHAAQLGRPLGAVPGPITSPTSAGCHRLIREYDAVCVTTPDEMAELVIPYGVDPPADARTGESLDARVLRELSTAKGRTMADLSTRTGASSHDLTASLGRLGALDAVLEGGDGWRAARRDG